MNLIPILLFNILKFSHKQ